MHNTENIIELLEDFIDFLKEKEDKVVVIEEEEDAEANDYNFDKTIDKIAKGE